MNRTIFSSSSQVLHAGGRVSTRHYVRCSSYQALLQDYKIRGSTSKPSTYTKFQEHLGTGRFREPQQRCQCTRCSKSLKQAVAGPRTIHMIVSVSVYKVVQTVYRKDLKLNYPLAASNKPRTLHYSAAYSALPASWKLTFYCQATTLKPSHHESLTAILFLAQSVFQPCNT